MYGLDYNHLANIRDTRGREAAYAEQLKADYYKNALGSVLEDKNRAVINAVEHSGVLVKDAIDGYNSSLTEQYERLNGSLEDLEGSLVSISDELISISSEMNNISGVLEWGFNVVIENQRLSLLVLTGIEQLAKIPDREKERIMLIQQGIERQHEAFYNPALYRNAIAYYEKALRLREDDPFVLNRLGFIHLYAPEHIDFEMAVDYFEKAVDFILPKFRSKQHLAERDIYDPMPGLLAPQLFSDLRQQTALSLYYAAQANILQATPERAKMHLENALAVTPAFQEARYLYIKVVLMLEEPGLVEQLVRQMLEQSPYYYFKFKKDIFFLQHPLVIHYADRYEQEMRQEIAGELNAIRDMLVTGSVLKRYFNQVLACFQTRHFVGLVKAQRLLAKKISADFNTLQYEA